MVRLEGIGRLRRQAARLQCSAGGCCKYQPSLNTMRCDGSIAYSSIIREKVPKFTTSWLCISWTWLITTSTSGHRMSVSNLPGVSSRVAASCQTKAQSSTSTSNPSSKPWHHTYREQFFQCIGRRLVVDGLPQGGLQHRQHRSPVRCLVQHKQKRCVQNAPPKPLQQLP